jgi:hypothetical protein
MNVGVVGEHIRGIEFMLTSMLVAVLERFMGLLFKNLS